MTFMDLIEHHLDHALWVEDYADTWLQVRGKHYDYPIILGNDIFRLPEKQPNDLTLASFQAALDDHVEIIIIGTGTQQQFLSPELNVALAQCGVGVACMNTAAACRLLSLLHSENRRVWAWLWI